jgi:2-polyprenyl-3-methyl-5-hydroxy-6-metoxy-1,4-benzoquinol methylase
MPIVLDKREVVPEVMDEPGLDPRAHRQALRGLARINRVSRSAQTIWSALRPMVRRRRLTVLDVACGGGDVLVALYRLARRDGVTLVAGGCDVSDTAMACAADHARAAGLEFHSHRQNALQRPLPTGYDVAISSLFLHHLHREEALVLLRQMSAASGSIVVSDLARSRVGYAAAWLGTRVLSRSRIVHIDGPRSVRAAFSIREARDLATAAGLGGAAVRRTWPFRWLLVWHRGGAGGSD